MSDFLATLLGLAFALVVCLVAVQAILGPWLRVRRSPSPVKMRALKQSSPPTPAPDSTQARSA